MIIAEFLGPDDAMQICLHQFLDKVYLLERFERRWLEYVKDGDDVFVTKVPEEFDFAESTETKHGMIERSDAFDGYFSLRGYMNG